MASPYALPPYATIPGNHRRYTLRSTFEEYRDLGGVCWIDADPPEYSVTCSTGEITCMARIENVVGLPRHRKYVGLMPRFHPDLQSVCESVMSWLSDTIDSGYIWTPPDCTKFTETSEGAWKHGTERLGADVGAILSQVQSLSLHPLTISTVHAAMESEKISRQETFKDFYPFPRTTVPSAGLFGTSHNNSFVDMSPLEQEKEPDMRSRQFEKDMVGYICASHTSHSYEAGRSRRVTEDVLVRLLNYETYRNMERLSSRQRWSSSEQDDWTVFCCGQACRVSRSTVDQMCILHRLCSLGKDPGYGLYLSERVKVCIICVAPGVLTKKCSNGVWADSCNSHLSDTLKFSLKPRIDTKGSDFHRSCLSGHYSYIPFVEYNAAVRTSISSAQIIQAVCMPHCPAVAAVSPCYVSKPIVTTPAYKRIMISQDMELDAASYLPGENVCVLYHNLPLNFEDAVVVSKRYVDNGGFSTMSTCRYLLPPTDYVPPAGSVICSRLCKWWKSKCQRYCKHTIEHVETTKACSPYYSPTGILLSRAVLKTGEQSVKVRSHAQYQAGDKVSTGHGQKGVASALVAHEDMPICITADGMHVIPDVVVAVGSLVTRQTVGQVYESGASIERLKDPSIDMVVQPDEIRGTGEDVSVMDGRTGRDYTTAVEDVESSVPTLKPTLATLGYIRMFNQSQMTREKHFTSHRSVTKNTLRTPTRRSRGGALRDGEMEVQAMVAAGLVNCTEELRKRGDEVVVHVCSKCQRLRLLHSCTQDSAFLEVTLPYDMLVLDCVNKITYNVTFQYELEPDT